MSNLNNTEAPNKAKEFSAVPRLYNEQKEHNTGFELEIHSDAVSQESHGSMGQRYRHGDSLDDVARQVVSNGAELNSTFDAHMDTLGKSKSPEDERHLTTPKSKAKHKPVSPQGTEFLWKDNMQYHEIGSSPFKLNDPQPDLLTVKLTATSRVVYTYSFPQKENPDWSSQAFITHANRWFHQIIIRHLDNNPANKEESKKRAARPQWSLQEQTYLHDLIEQGLEKSESGRLSDRDWQKITNKLNRRFEGDMMQIGQGYVDLRAVKQEKKPNEARKGWAVTNTAVKPFMARPVGGCKAAIKFWPKTKEMIAKAAEDTKPTNKGQGTKRGYEALIDDDTDDDDDFDDGEVGGIKSPSKVRLPTKRRMLERE